MPFLAEDEHEGCVASWGINWSKGHDVEGEKDAVRACKAKFGTIRVADADLMETRFGVDANPIEAAGTGGEVINGFIAAGNGKVVIQCDGVEAAVGNTESPDKVRNVGDMLLMRFGSEDDHGKPTSEVRETTEKAPPEDTASRR